MSTLERSDVTAGEVRVRRGGVTSWAALGVLGLVVVLMAVVVPYQVSLGTLTNLVGLFVLVILGTSWNLMAGYAGMVSIGQQAFIGIGGYGVIHLADAVGLPLLAAVAAAAVVSGLVAFATSFLVFRLAGGYFAIGTWVVAEVLKLLTTQVDALGGGSGLSLTAFRGVDRVSRVATVYWLGLALAVLVVAAAYLLMRSRTGLGLTALRDDPTAAAGLGVPVTRSKRLVYVGSSAAVGLAGALTALTTLRVTPDSIFSVQFTAAMIFVVLIGGIGTIEGPVLGAVVYYLLEDQLADLGSWYLVILGLVAVVVVMVAPRGLWGLLTRAVPLQVFPVAHRTR